MLYVLGCVELTSTEGVIRGPFGNIIGFYNYEKDITTDERGYLIDICLSTQDQYKRYLDYFRIEY